MEGCNRCGQEIHIQATPDPGVLPYRFRNIDEPYIGRTEAEAEFRFCSCCTRASRRYPHCWPSTDGYKPLEAGGIFQFEKLCRQGFTEAMAALITLRLYSRS